ncbi:leucine-rich repeat protein [Draconibacterium halophilum]|uniref:Leucine-rich repeat protein n=1 Tax=Draconibacterium halophilum TaxID=2706887 RepID=A0A6C0REQ4_9BACT|nr:leucine-rich repeat protein [Draconibacterium halophilum]QIA08165.1 leucine-rich repeat protein [Draconibacterium halophilum]
MKKLLLLSTFLFILVNVSRATYTLTSSDVTISNGVITSCSLPAGINAIIIPETIDGQTVTGIANRSGYNQGVFYNKNLMAVTLPSTIEFIGNFAFCVNNISLLDLTNCTSLKSIGEGAFYNNALPSVNFSPCTALETIGEAAFEFNALVTVDFTNCTSLKSIGRLAFSGANQGFPHYNQVNVLIFTGCTSLTTISGYAFYSNNMSSASILTPCTALSTIGEMAFADQNFGFYLPTVVGFEKYGWYDGNGNTYNGGDLVTDTETSYYAPTRHTLTDADVYITDGIITYCFYDYKSKEIIIPDELKGETVTGIGDGIFKDEGITAVFFPPTLKMIGNSAFSDNSIETIDLDTCTSLTFIGLGAFSGNVANSFKLPTVVGFESDKWVDQNDTEYDHGATITDLTATYRLPAPYTLTSADVEVVEGVLTTCSYGFQSKEIIIPRYLDGQYVKEIGNAVFNDKGIIAVELPTTLEKIGEWAFAQNNLAAIDLSVCNELRYIAKDAFRSNGFTSFNLPVVNRLEPLGWYVGYRTVPGGSEVTVQDNIYYNMYVPVYVLTDADVVVTNNVIVSCSSVGGSRAILIPSELDNQTVKEIGNAIDYEGVFENKTLDYVSLPTSIEKIGTEAFEDNYIKKLSLEDCNNLTHIRNDAFYGNQISTLNLTNCVALSHIEDDAFYDNAITSNLDLSDCPQLTTIGDNAFAYSSIPSIDFSNCSLLEYIGEYAFEENSISSLDLTNCNKLIFIGSDAFSSNSLTNFQLPVITGYENEKWRDNNGNTFAGNEIVSDFSTFYSFPKYYTITDDDVVVENSTITSCSYNFASKDIIIPNTLDGQTIKGIADYEREEIFNRKDLFSIQLPTTIEYLGKYSFNNNRITNLNLDDCNTLIFIGSSAFASNNLTGFKLPVYTANDTIKWIDENGTEYSGGDSTNNLYLSYRLTVPYTLTDEDVVVENNAIVSCSYNFASKDIIIPNTLDGQTVTEIASQTEGIFEEKGLTSVELPTTIELIGKRAFKNNSINSINIAECSALVSVGEEAFNENNLANLDLSNCNNLTKIEYGAFKSNKIENIDLENCSLLDTIESYAFQSNNISNLDLSGCPNIKFIGFSAFQYNSIQSLNLTNCSSLTTIDNSSFAYNSISYLDLTSCTALESIGDYAFRNSSFSNPDLSKCTSLVYIGRYAFYKSGGNTFTLPTPNIPNKVFDYWEDNNGIQYAGNTQVSDITLTYTAVLFEGNKVTFTITDGANPVANALVSLDGYDDKISDNEGIASFAVTPSDSIFYAISATNYMTVSDSVWSNDSINSEQVTLQFCADSVTINEEICGNETINIGDSTYAESGTYITTLTNVAGCDSIVTLFLNVLPAHTVELNEVIGMGEEIIVGNTAYSTSGMYVNTLTNQFNCDSTITLNLTVDSIAPSAVCQTTTIYLDETGSATLTADLIDGGSSDNLNELVFEVSRNSFTCSDIGTNNVQLIVTDNVNLSDTCTAVVTVEDTIAPEAVCKNIDVWLDDSGAAQVSPNDINNGSTDNCGNPIMNLNNTDFTCDDIGTNLVLLTVTDSSNNSATCSANITVLDTISPTAICKDIDVYLDANGTATITADSINNGSFANCEEISKSINTNEFNCSKLGTNTVILTLEANNQKTASCTSMVTVIDTLSPIVSAQNLTIYIDTSECLNTISVSDIKMSSSDNCSIVDETITKSSFTCADTGTVQTVELWVTDSSGNIGKAISSVTIKALTDTIPPTVLCQPTTIYLDETGSATLMPSYIDGGVPTTYRRYI